MEPILKYFSEFTPKQLAQFTALNELYKDWNSKINVISRKDMEGLYEKHVLHSLSIAAIFDFAKGTEIIDIGTGGGFPGIPLAIYFPEVNFYLVDSIAKKLKVVQEVAAAIGLKNVTTQHTRAEEIKNRKFDFAVSRAVAPLVDLWRWSKPLLKNREINTTQSEKHVQRMELNQDQNPASQILKSGLICLKGGNLANEISESGTRPIITAIQDIFTELYFADKYLLYVRR